MEENVKKKDKLFNNLHEEVAYYKLKYKKYKEKYKVYSDMQAKLRQEYSDLLLKHEILNDELKSEKILRKKFEEKVICYMKLDHLKDCKKNINNEYEDLDKLNKNINYNEGISKANELIIDPNKNVPVNIVTHSNSGETNYFRVEVLNTNRNSDINSNFENQFFRNSELMNRHNDSSLIETSPSSSFDIREKEILIGNNINKNTKNIISTSHNDTNLTSTNLKERNLKEITNKFDVEKLKRSLTIDFIEFEKDSLAMRRKTILREDKINKLEKVLHKWIEITENLRKSFDTVCNSMQTFSDDFVQEPLEIFDECPDLISLIYTLNSVISDMINQFKIFSVSIENSFVNQIKIFLNHSMQELKESKQSLVKHSDEFNYISSKFLSTKKCYIKDLMKDNYLSQFKLLEFTRYDFINKINQGLLFIKIELPEKISLLIYAFMSLFKQGNEILNKIEYNVNANLEKISVKYKEKEKIVEEIKMNKKDLAKSFDTVNTSIQTKEGFLYVKQKDANQYFKKRYFKIYNGNLIFFKMKKGTEQIDLSKHFNLCNLLLSNAKRNEKEYEYPFCFEIICATNKKVFILQGETDKESEEWVCAIRNAIANSISHYQTDNTALKENPIDNGFYLNYSDTIDKKDNMIDKLISQSKCTDCDSENPTWCSINWLCLICIDCSGVHRSLGVQITKIRSLRLDNLEPELIELIDIMGQDKINNILESLIKSYEKPKSNAMFADKENYITNKYKNKKYIKNPVTNNFSSKNINSVSSDVSHAASIFKFIDNDNLINIYHYSKLELCDLNKIYDLDKDRYCFLHHCAKKGKLNSFKLFILLGADIQSTDSKNLKPIDYATIYKNSEIADFIVKKLDELK